MSVCGGNDVDTLDSAKVKSYKHSTLYINIPVDTHHKIPKIPKIPKKRTIPRTDSESVSSNEINFKKEDESIITTNGLLTCDENKHANNNHRYSFQGHVL